MAFETTSAHIAIFDAIKAKSRNLLVEAVAGSGKTSTILEALRFVPASEQCVFLAFNASIAKELGRRVPGHVEARTMNSLGNRAWTRHLQRTGVAQKHQVDGEKMNRILRKWEDEGRLSPAQRRVFGYPAMRAARLAKGAGLIVAKDGKEGCEAGMVPDLTYVWTSMIDDFDIEIPDEPEDALSQIVLLARELLAESTLMTTIVDFDDQIYLPFVYDIDSFRYDRVFVDESQDLSPIQHTLLDRSLKKDGQLVAVGDPRQAIYGFRGADAQSMASLERSFACVKLPLHVSYRCPIAVVQAAQAVVQHIQAHPSAPMGLVDPVVVRADRADLRAGDLVLCRTTVPVVKLAYNLLRQGRACEVLGRDLGKSLETLVTKCDKTGLVDAMLEKLAIWEEKEVARAVARGSESRAASIEDRCATLRVLCEGQTRVSDVLAVIAQLFTGDRSTLRITLSTVHKAKGLEADRVWILNPHLMPHPMAKRPWQREQEANLIYVAITRSKSELRYMTDSNDRAG